MSMKQARLITRSIAEGAWSLVAATLIVAATLGLILLCGRAEALL